MVLGRCGHQFKGRIFEITETDKRKVSVDGETNRCRSCWGTQSGIIVTSLLYHAQRPYTSYLKISLRHPNVTCLPDKRYDLRYYQKLGLTNK